MLRRSRLLGLVLIGLAASLLLVVVGAAIAALPPGGTFIDDNGNTHEGNIEAIAAEGITLGCNPPTNNRYCPSDAVNRGQMAAFLNRAFNFPASEVDYFTDDNGTTFEADINAIAKAGITQGCNPPTNNRYCPSNAVTRGQMAAFLNRTFTYPAATTDYFSDDNGTTFEDDINAIAKAGITLGCNPPTNSEYCPSGIVRRDQMASFLARAMDLTPIVPPPAPTTTSTTTVAPTTTTAPPGPGTELPSNWSRIVFQSRTYLCYNDPWNFDSHYDCVVDYGQEPPLLFWTPDLYCSGSSYSMRCDALWYPDDLDAYEFVTYSGSLYICDDAYGIYSGWNDYDCQRYNGGSPPYRIYPDLMCTNDWGWTCSTEYYPSEMDNRFFSRINYNEHVCENTWQGSECWRYFGGHPEAAMSRLPDYYCNYKGCSTYDYP